MNVPMRWGTGATRTVTGIRNPGRKASRVPISGSFVWRPSLVGRHVKFPGAPTLYLVMKNGSIRRVRTTE